jgi:DNA-binding transcriptional LysR family regulator
MDWDDLRTFLSIAQTRTLSGAARALGVRQSTMSRRLEALEQRAGARLLQKMPHGYELTPLGEAVLGNAERMEAEAIAVERIVQGRDVALSGVVRVTMVDVLASRFMPLVIAALQCKHPQIVIDLEPDVRSLSLSKREADIALRMVSFEGNELVSRKIGSLANALYASHDYIKARGQLNEDGIGHTLISVPEDQTHLPEIRWLREKLPRAAIGLRTGSREAQLWAAKSGVGIACLSCFHAEGEVDLQRLTSIAEGPVRNIWLGVHQDLRYMPRIRAVIDVINSEMAKQSALMMPQDIKPLSAK